MNDTTGKYNEISSHKSSHLWLTVINPLQLQACQYYCMYNKSRVHAQISNQLAKASVKQKWKSDIEELLCELEKDLDLLVFASDGQQTEDGKALHKRN